MHAVCVGGIKFHFSYPPSIMMSVDFHNIYQSYLSSNKPLKKYHSFFVLSLALEVWMQYVQFYFILVERVIVGQFLPTIVRCLQPLMTFLDP